MEQEEEDQGFIRDLPDEVAYRCLTRVSVQTQAQLHGVSRKWRDLVTSREFYERRKQQGLTKHCVCMLQALPTVDSSPHPVFGVSMMNEESEQLWEWLPPIPEFAQYGLPLFCRLAAVSRSLLVLGGWHPRTWETLRTVYIFDFLARKWRRGADMPSTRSSFACQALGSDVFVAGGHNNAKIALPTAEVYSTVRDRWQALPKMNDSRDECSAAVLDGELYIISGYETASQGQFMQSSEVFKPALNAWTRTWIGLTLVSRSSCDVIKPHTNVHSRGQLPLFGFHQRELVWYSAEKDEWQLVDVLPEGEDSIADPVCVTQLGADKLFVTGPRNGDDSSFTSLVYTLDLRHEDRRQSDEHASVASFRGKWEFLRPHEKFQEVIQTSCVVEI
jgi:hypothetical protein